ncbi:Bug family tripartite tricarboxylate transporter substrate binding protein, partial [Acinetobacter baumannii]|uniref:Bug family tripartite tricarboxylate transporter substrate binding protein n=1 Tax=Acinetobacter baumannii TaxID=470 RepID=UPI0022438DEB
RTLKDLVDAAKAKPGQLNYGSAGLGSSTGIAAEVFRHVTGTRMQLVPYRGMPESQTSVLRGDSAFCFTFFNVGGDLIQAGRLRALAVTGETRMAQLPG